MEWYLEVVYHTVLPVIHKNCALLNREDTNIMMNSVIKPCTMNVLCSNPAPARRGNFERQSQPQPKLKTFWNKFCGLIKKVAAVIVSALTILPPVLNSISRCKETFKECRRCDNGSYSYSH